MKTILAVIGALAAASVQAAPFYNIASQQTSFLASQDPFYIQPKNIKSYEPGQVIRNRTLTPQLAGTVSGAPADVNLKAAYQYLYRTTNSLGHAVAAVNTLLVPNKNADPSKLLSYQTSYDTANNDCSPSYTLRPGSKNKANVDEVLIIAALNRGWYVTTADYAGLQAQFTAGSQAGYATLDGVRAVINQSKTNGLAQNARHALWGYSWGALATEWASELQTQYAPELKFEGAALGGLTPNLTSVLRTVNMGSASRLAFSGIAGLSKIWPNATTWLESNLIPSKRQEFLAIAAECSNTKDGEFKDIGSYFVNGLDSFNEAIPQQLLEYVGLMGRHGTPRYPLYVYKAAGDEISDIRDTDALYSNLCSKGASILYNRNAGGKHLSEAVTGAGGAISWIADRLNGLPVSNDGKCVQNTVVETQLDVGAFEGLSDILISELRSVL